MASRAATRALGSTAAAARRAVAYSSSSISSSSHRLSTLSAFASPPPPSSSSPASLRHLSTTRQSLAEEAGGSFGGFPGGGQAADTDGLFERLQHHPEVIVAIEELSRLASEKTGVDLRRGEKPTMGMMMQLAGDSELRAAAERLMTSLKDAGIHIDPRAALSALKTIGGKEFDELEVGDQPLGPDERRGGSNNSNDNDDDKGGKK